MEKSRLVDIAYQEDGQCQIAIQTVGESNQTHIEIDQLLSNRALLRTLSLSDLHRLQEIVTDTPSLQPLAKLQFWIFCKLESMTRTVNEWEREVSTTTQHDFDDW